MHQHSTDRLRRQSCNMTKLNAIFLVLVGNEKVLSGGLFVLVPNEIRNGLVLGLFGGALVALIAFPEELFLDKVDGWVGES